MKRIIDIDEDYYEIIKHDVKNGQDYKPFVLIANSIPYEERPQGDALELQFKRGYEAGTVDAYHANADDLARLKTENNRLTAELEQAYELINSIRAERSRQACPFGDDRETCAFYKENGCDFCKLAIK